jgi:hypothetical protein
MLPEGKRPSIALDPPSTIPLTTRATLMLAAVLSVYRQALDCHGAFTNASSLLATALLDSIGDNNWTQIESTFHPLPLYAITPAQIVDEMITVLTYRD